MKRHTVAEMAAQAADRLAIEELNAWFCHCLDTQQYDSLGEVLTPDVHYTSGPRTLIGLDTVITQFTTRAQQTLPRTTRHLQSGLRLQFDADGLTAHGLSVAVNYAAHGEAPADSLTPFVVADFTDTYQRGQDDRWRIKTRIITPILRNPDLAPRPRHAS